jgi:hypothetical protein
VNIWQSLSPAGFDAMTKKRLLLIASLPLAVALVIGVLAMLPPRPGVTKANFDRIETGMTESEVEQILGGKAKCRVGGETVEAIWEADDASSTLVEFEADRVFRKQWFGSHEAFLAKICRWLHLR